MPADPVRIRDLPYIDWLTIAHRIRPEWSEDEMDASWDQHIQYRVWLKAEVTHA